MFEWGQEIVRTTKQSTVRIFLLWLLVVPMSMYYVVNHYVPLDFHWQMVVLYSLFGFFTVLFPIKHNGIPIFSAMWITVPAFLLHGLLIEVIVMQISIVAVLRLPQLKGRRLYCFFFNSFWFFIVSIVSAMIYFLAGGVIGSLSFWPLLLAVFCYQLVHTMMTRPIFRSFIHYTDLKSTFFVETPFISYGKIFVIVPLSLTLFYLYSYVGAVALFLLGIPYFFLTQIIRMNNLTEKINDDLQRAGIIGHEISGKVTVNDVVDEFVLKISEMFDTDYTYLLSCKDNALTLIRAYEVDDFVEVNLPILKPGDGVAGRVLMDEKPAFYAERDEFVDFAFSYINANSESILCVPILRNGKVEAVLLLASSRKNAFTRYQLKILDFLGSYFTVSIEKTKYLQDVVVESNRCALTKLYNYRYLEQTLTMMMKKINEGLIDELSVVMLDIDYFKKVNDTYGHQSGNDILMMLAEKLKVKVPEGSIIARYGGEEFIFLLNGIGKEGALVFAEELRVDIERSEFAVNPYLGDNQTAVVVRITVSVGVATAPEDAENAQTLLRNADRTLYLWAKQAGRNRVASYVK